LQQLGNIDQAEMDRVFNGGIGFVVICAPFFAESIRERLEKEGYPAHLIGEIRTGEPGVEWV
jgi:phosphoribosylformylglycinamidine cyclo-ligase